MYLSYVYRVVNNITGQFYIGSRCKNVKLKRKASEDFWVKYFTSSKKIKELREQHGDSSFSFEILFESEDYDSVYWKEQEFIKETITNPLCVNLQYVDRTTGKKKFSFGGMTQKMLAWDEQHGTETANIYRKRVGQQFADMNRANKGKTWEEMYSPEVIAAKRLSTGKAVRGKTYEEVYGEDADRQRKMRSKPQAIKGKTYEEVYGEDAARLLRERKSASMKETLAKKRAAL